MSIERSILDTMHEYVPGKSIKEVSEEYGLEKVIKLASNENPLGVSPLAQKAIAENTSLVNTYPLGHSPELAIRLAAVHSVSVDNLLFSNGSDEMIQMIATTFLNPGEEVISSDHTFSEYKFATKLFDGVYISVPLNDWNHDLDAILAAITDRTKLIFICSPNNPTGTWVNREDMQKFLDAVPANIMVVVDQAYSEFATDERYPTLIEESCKRTNLILLRTFSKLYGLAGLRVGYAITDSETKRKLSKVKQPFNVNLLAQAAARAVLDDTQYIDETLRVNEEGKRKLYQWLDSQNIEYLKTQGNFIAVKLGERSIDIVKTLESKGMIIRSLKSFDMPDWVRITIGQKEQNEVLISLLEEVL